MDQKENSAETINLGTSEQAKQTIGNLESQDSSSLKFVKSYFSLFINNLNKLDILQSDALDQCLADRTTQILPVRDEFFEVVSAIAQFTEEKDFYFEIHNFFEQLIPYFYPRESGESKSKLAQDHYKILGNEMFLLTVAILLKYRRFEQINILTQQGYYIERSNKYSAGRFINFNYFNQSLDAVKRAYNSSSSWDEQYIKTNFTKNRVPENFLNYEHIAQADFVLHFVTLIDSQRDKIYFSDIWAHQLFIESLPFEIFVRSESIWFFEQFRVCLRGLSKNELNTFLEEYAAKAANAFGATRVDYLKSISGFDNLATRP